MGDGLNTEGLFGGLGRVSGPTPPVSMVGEEGGLFPSIWMGGWDWEGHSAALRGETT